MKVEDPLFVWESNQFGILFVQTFCDFTKFHFIYAVMCRLLRLLWQWVSKDFWKIGILVSLDTVFIGRSSTAGFDKGTVPWFDAITLPTFDLFRLSFFFSVDFPDISRWDAIGFWRSTWSNLRWLQSFLLWVVECLLEAGPSLLSFSV